MNGKFNSTPTLWTKIGLALWLSLLLILLCNSSLLSQSFCDFSSWKKADSLSLERSYDRLAVDTQGNIYLLAIRQGLVKKFLQNYRYDSTLQMGGSFTRETEHLLRPIDIQVNNYQQLYLLDEGRRTLLIFGKELEVLGSLDFNQNLIENIPGSIASSLIPHAFSVNGLGEYFFLNPWDNKVYHFSAQGDFLQDFGGNDYGEGSLFAPESLYISSQNDILVADQNRVLHFDAFGTYQSQVQVPPAEAPRSLDGIGQQLLLLEDSTLLITRFLPLPQFDCQVSLPQKFKDLALSQRYCYLLGERYIWIYEME